jgi:PAS domain S-box-containing protein
MALTSIDPAETGRFVQVNRAMCELLGYSEDQLLGMSSATSRIPRTWTRASTPSGASSLARSPTTRGAG